MKAPGLAALAFALAGTAIGTGALVARAVSEPAGMAPAMASGTLTCSGPALAPGPAPGSLTGSVPTPLDPVSAPGAPEASAAAGHAAGGARGAPQAPVTPEARQVPPADPLSAVSDVGPAVRQAAGAQEWRPAARGADAGPPAALPASAERGDPPGSGERGSQGSPSADARRARAARGAKSPVGDLADVERSRTIATVAALAAPAPAAVPAPASTGAGSGNGTERPSPAAPPPPAEGDADGRGDPVEDSGGGSAPDAEQDPGPEEEQQGQYSGPPRVTLRAEASPGRPGQFVPVQVLVENAQNVGSIPFHLHFNPAVLRFEGSLQGPLLGSDGQPAVVMAAVLSSGDVVVVGASRLGPVPGLSGSGELCTLNFRVVGPGSTGLTFTEATVRDPAGVPIEASFVSTSLDLR